MLNLEQLGKRICIIGCNNSGKSTLAFALGKKLHLPVFHLDQYAHIENSNWQLQPIEVLIEKHHELIQQDAWIIEGNYSVCMEPRFDRATAVIWLDSSVYGSVWRYLLRSLKGDVHRPGGLKGAKREFRLWLVKWIVVNYPKNRLRYKNLLANRPQLLLLHMQSMQRLKEYYKFWKLNKG